mgnify:FL=1
MIVENYEKALSLLHDGYVLLLTNEKGKTYASYAEGFFYLKTNNSRFKLKPEDFEKLYGNSIFSLVKTSGDNLIDDKKDDEEYYRWEHK